MSVQTEGGAAFDQLHDLLLTSQDINGFLSEFTTMLAQRLSTADAEVWCAVSLLRQRKATTVTCSSSQAEALDETQNQFRDGPCLTAIREHTVVRVGDVAADGRWPAYLAVAADQGVHSILGVPFALGEDANAGLNVYSDRAHHFDPDTIASIELQVALASKGLRLAVRLARHREAEADLTAAMTSRTIIDLAVGIVMAQNRCPQQEAFEILKAASNHRNIKLRQIAADLVGTVSRGPSSTHFER
jgi:GAF domain-containing protein